MLPFHDSVIDGAVVDTSRLVPVEKSCIDIFAVLRMAVQLAIFVFNTRPWIGNSYFYLCFVRKND